jgi:hypothetical protein
MVAWPGGEFNIKLWSGGKHEEIAIPPANHYQLMAEDFADALLDGSRCRGQLHDFHLLHFG